jgi:hypothetical protein
MRLKFITNARVLGSSEARERGRLLTLVALILHERLGNWARQLRPRLHDLPIRWFETRSRADLDTVLTGLACPVVLIDPGKHLAAALLDLDLVLSRAPDALILLNNPDCHTELTALARELGATYVLSGFVPPPEVAGLLIRWITLARRHIERDGWSRTSSPEKDFS